MGNSNSNNVAVRADRDDVDKSKNDMALQRELSRHRKAFCDPEGKPSVSMRTPIITPEQKQEIEEDVKKKYNLMMKVKTGLAYLIIPLTCLLIYETYMHGSTRERIATSVDVIVKIVEYYIFYKTYRLIKEAGNPVLVENKYDKKKELTSSETSEGSLTSSEKSADCITIIRISK